MESGHEGFNLLLERKDLQVWGRLPGGTSSLIIEDLTSLLFNTLILLREICLSASLILTSTDKKSEDLQVVVIRSGFVKKPEMSRADIEKICADVLTSKRKKTTLVAFDDDHECHYFPSIELMNEESSEMAIKKIHLSGIKRIVSTLVERNPPRRLYFCQECGIVDCFHKRCTGCKKVYYCSREHQRSHWLVHKEICK